MPTARSLYDLEDRERDGALVEEPRPPPADPEPAADERAKLARALHDLQGARARVERDARLVHEETRSKLVAELLPVLDNLDRAIEVAESSGDAAAVVEGVRLVRRQFESVLAGYGLQRFDAVGTAFDPLVHDATNIIAVDDPTQDRIVVAQLEPGYTFGARLLRPAKVVVGRHG